MITNIYQIHYNEDTKRRVHPGCIGIDNSLRTQPYPSLESRTICDLFLNEIDSDYVGVLSWKFEMKRPITIGRIKPLMSEDNYQHDVYSFFKSFEHRHQLWQKAESWHHGIIEIAADVFSRIGIVLDIKRPIQGIYQNAHITRTEIYREFVDTWLRPFVDIIEVDVELQTALNKRAPYKTGNTANNTPEQLIKATGQPHYTMHPFICERVFPTFLSHNRHIKIKHFC